MGQGFFSLSEAIQLDQGITQSLFRNGERGALAPCLRGPSLTGQGADAPRSPGPDPSGTDSQSHPNRPMIGIVGELATSEENGHGQQAGMIRGFQARRCREGPIRQTGLVRSNAS